ncbi:coil containing protein [Vibrio phage 409E50-1]|nr:coil containing protein [Vibrio phage 521E56-1]CAH9012504.1 coil containing protein [Vibrio phage 384E50-1]CAH9012545.1 coil containing protein [Vibrio phage 409E50-1]CAH9012558.1 coil containing protein [Vibrio phage 402E50-1]CAH9013513.1 coil containing protein [Vibrio phage 405E50-1]CAH9013577.1 coil containing protein [Vibrio phage 413E50-1]
MTIYFDQLTQRTISSDDLDDVFGASMHQPVMALEEPVLDSKGSSANPVGSFNEVIAKASEGDTLRSIDVDYHANFTRGKDYSVIMGVFMLSNGKLTIMDDSGLEVPVHEAVPVSDTFMLIPKVDERVEMLNNLRTKRDSMTADAQSIVDDIAALDEFDAEWHTPFGLMSDEDKGALLLASSEGKEIQGYLPARFSDNVWHETDFDKPLWNTQAYYRVKPLSYKLLDSILMDMKFEITELDAAIHELQAAIDSDW